MEQSKGAIRKMMEKVEELSDADSIQSGTYVQLSNGIQGIYNTLEDMESGAMDFGVSGHVMQCLITDPTVARMPNHQIRLQDADFAARLVVIKVDSLRIARGLFEQGPELIQSEVLMLYCWGALICQNALKSWEWHFVPSPGHRKYGPDDPDEQVPPKFRALVIELIRMQLDLFPIILGKLNKWNVAGSNIFPQSSWSPRVYSEELRVADSLLTAMAVEPRMIPFVIGKQFDIDMNGLSKQGPRLRSNTAHFPSSLNFEQIRMIKTGIAIIRGAHNGYMHQQKFNGPWRARNIFAATALGDIVISNDHYF